MANKKQQRTKEFKESRTSWKWFENQFERHHSIADALHTKESFLILVAMEVLKELQYLNDK